MIINVKVKTSSGKQEVVKEDKMNEKDKRVGEDSYIVYLKSAPENNKANVELVKLLQRYFKSEVKIKSGLRSKNKVVEVLK